MTPQGANDEQPLPRAAARIVAFDAIAPDVWDRVAGGRRTPMAQHIWSKAAAEAISPDRPVEVYCVGEPGAPLALAPFARRGARLILLGAEELGEPFEVIYGAEAALPPLARLLAAGGSPVGFGHYLADTPWTDALKDAYRGRGAVIERRLEARAAPTIELDSSWTKPEERLSSRRRADLRRMHRIAEQDGAVSFECLSPGADDVDALLDEAFSVEAASWKQRAGTAILQNDVQSRFYRLYGRLAAGNSLLRILFLRIGGQVAAMQVAVETEGGFWLLKIGYNEAYKRCSPGNLLMREAIRIAAERRLKTFEFLGKEAPWTLLWTENAKPIVALRAYPASLPGLAALATDGAQMARKALKTRSEKAHA